jgi:hypothetical protein
VRGAVRELDRPAARRLHGEVLLVAQRGKQGRGGRRRDGLLEPREGGCGRRHDDDIGDPGRRQEPSELDGLAVHRRHDVIGEHMGGPG